MVRIRAFFAERGVLEVETPLLAPSSATDPHLASLESRVLLPGGRRRLFLQTSPELAMKRLLAAGSGPIYQICKAFRDGERGPMHNPEFTILEWYRPGFDHHALMDEMDALLARTLGLGPARRRSWASLFEAKLGIDPHRAEVAELAAAAAERGLEASGLGEAERETWVDLMMSHFLEPTLGRGRPTFVTDYPASQAALAKVRPGPPAVAERFEVYVEGVELANGFHELTDPAEQRRRFLRDNRRRRRMGLPEMPLDELFLAALEHGLPASAGVALGIDRLLLLALGAGDLDAVLAWPTDRI